MIGEMFRYRRASNCGCQRLIGLKTVVDFLPVAEWLSESM